MFFTGKPPEKNGRYCAKPLILFRSCAIIGADVEKAMPPVFAVQTAEARNLCSWRGAGVPLVTIIATASKKVNDFEPF